MKYCCLLKVYIKQEMKYKGSILIKSLSQLIWGFMKILIFYAFYKSSDDFPTKFSSCTSYIWLEQIFLNFFAFWTIRKNIVETIENGNIVYELVKPIHLYSLLFFKEIFSRLSHTMTTGLTVFCIARLLPEPFKLNYPNSFKSIFLFIISLLFGFLIFLSMIIIVYTISFYIPASNGIISTFTAIVEFFSGRVIPLIFLPKKINNIIKIMPFSYTQNFCFQIYSENLYYDNILKGILMQIFWVFILITLGVFFMRKAQKKIIYRR